MSSERIIEFTKDNIDLYLKEVAKEYRKLSEKRTPAELIIVGGASVMINYNFRSTTTDIDAIIQASSSMKDAINRVRDRFDLPNGWLNADFTKTDSYTSKLAQFSDYYKTFSNIISVRTVSAEYLIAMKLRSGRQYKSDLSDVLGILKEHTRNENPITMEQIQKAVIDLYGEWDSLSEETRAFIENVMESGHFDQLYEQTARGEQETKELLIQFENNYPGVTKEANVDNIAKSLQKKADKASILAILRQKKTEGKAPAPGKNPSRKNKYKR